MPSQLANLTAPGIGISARLGLEAGLARLIPEHRVHAGVADNAQMESDAFGLRARQRSVDP
jgi:hypothetical protein